MAILALLLFVMPFLFLFLKRFLFGAHELPPGPNPFRALTYLSQLIHKPHTALQKLSQIYGPLVSFQLGSRLIVVASSPETAKEFFKTHDRLCSGRFSPSVYENIPGTMHSSIVLASDYTSKSWKLLRSLGQNSVFSSKAMGTNSRIRKSKVADLVNHLRTREGEAVDLEELVYATIANIISTALTSRNLFDIEGRAKDDYKVVMAITNEIIENNLTFGVVDFFTVLKGVDFWSKRKAMDQYQKMKRTWGGIIKERKSMGRREDSTEDFLDVVLADNTFSEDQIGSTLMELLIGGTDSATITTVWLIVELMRNQEMLFKVRDEMAQAAEGDELNEARLSECRFFEACIKETLRLHIPAPMLMPHRVIETCKVNNYVIPKDSMVLVNAWAIARDPNYWEDATTFKPERFLDSKIGYMGAHFEYLPFGTGLRMCPGSGVAIKNIQMLVGSLVYHFDWSLPNGADPTTIDTSDKYSTTLKKAKKLFLIPKLRKSIN